jgi:hypothetical protein
MHDRAATEADQDEIVTTCLRVDPGEGNRLNWSTDISVGIPLAAGYFFRAADALKLTRDSAT